MSRKKVYFLRPTELLWQLIGGTIINISLFRYKSNFSYFPLFDHILNQSSFGCTHSRCSFSYLKNKLSLLLAYQRSKKKATSATYPLQETLDFALLYMEHLSGLCICCMLPCKWQIMSKTDRAVQVVTWWEWSYLTLIER